MRSNLQPTPQKDARPSFLFFGNLLIEAICAKEKRKVTRPDTRQSGRGRLGRSSNAKEKRSEFKNVTDRPTDGPTYRPTDRHGKV